MGRTEKRLVMGLDQVELILSVEEVFGVSISDEEAGSVRTVGDLHNLICKEMGVDSNLTSQCINLLAFHRLRSGLLLDGSVARCDIRREARIADLIPKRGRRRRWKAVGERTRLALPSLVRPPWFVFVLVTAGMISAIGTAWFYGAFAAIASGVAASLLLSFGSRPLATEFPDDCSTVGLMTRTIAGLNHGALVTDGCKSSRSEVWEALVEVIVDQMSISRSEIHPEASISEDLKID